MRETSRKEFTSSDTVEHINCGSLQRIADALEKVALNYDSLLRDKKWAEEMRDRYKNKLEFEMRRTAALRGVITKMKKGAK